MRYIEMHRGPAAYVLDPPPSRGGDLELEGRVNACYLEYVYSAGHQESRKCIFFTQCTLSQSYFKLFTNKTYQHDPQCLLIN